MSPKVGLEAVVDWASQRPKVDLQNSKFDLEVSVSLYPEAIEVGQVAPEVQVDLVEQGSNFFE